MNFLSKEVIHDHVYGIGVWFNVVFLSRCIVCDEVTIKKNCISMEFLEQNTHILKSLINLLSWLWFFLHYIKSYEKCFCDSIRGQKYRKSEKIL